MQRLPLQLTDRHQWYDHFTGDENDAVLFCPTPTPPPAGSSVLVDLHFQSGPRIFLKGVVIWRRTRPSSNTRFASGAGIRIRGSDGPKIDFVNGYSRGGLLDQRGGARRLPVRLRTTYATPSGRRMNFTRDISETGVSLGCKTPAPLKSPLKMEIVFPSTIGTFWLQGWVVRHIEDDRGAGMAVSLTFADQGQRYELAGALRRLEKLLMEGTLPEQHLY
jgi:hypothetical protein